MKYCALLENKVFKLSFVNKKKVFKLEDVHYCAKKEKEDVNYSARSSQHKLTNTKIQVPTFQRPILAPILKETYESTAA